MAELGAAIPAPARPDGCFPFGTSSYIRAAADSAEMVIYDDIVNSPFGGVSSKDVALALASLGNFSELHVRLNSMGGDVFEGLAIYNLLCRVTAMKVVHVDALAASIASIIALAGDKVCTAPNAAWMIHEARCAFFGTEDEAGQMKDRLAMVNKTMADIYSQNTGKSPEECRAMMKATTWMDAKAAKEFGFSDETEGETGTKAPKVVLQASAIEKLDSMPPAIRAGLERIRAAATAVPPLPAPSAADVERSNMDKLIALLANLGIKATTEGEIIAAVAKLKEDAASAVQAQAKVQGDFGALLALSGKSTAAEALGEFQGLKAAAAQLPTITAELQALKAAAVTEKRDALIAQGTKDGKLPPALEPWAKGQTIESLTAFLAAATPVVVPVGAGKEPKPGEQVLVASDDQKKIAAAVGVSLEKVLATAKAATA